MPHAIAFIHEENGVFGASFADFPGCVTTDGTFDGVIARAAQALALHVAGMAEDGEGIPSLRSPAAIATDPTFAEEMSGAILVAVPFDAPGKVVRVNITMDEALLAAVDRAAAKAGSSRSGFLADAARERIAVEA